MKNCIQIILVEPSHPGNIGAAARAMKNMGLSRLTLVAPKLFPHAEATARAAGADDILVQARVVEHIDQALEGCRLVVGTSARNRALPWPLVNPRECVEQIQALFQHSEIEIAVLFGREQSGLTNEELHRCQLHLHIPTNPDFSSLNLAMAVQIFCYELAMLQPPQLMSSPKKKHIEETLATADELEHFYQHLEKALIEINFLDPAVPKHLMARLRRLFGRSGLNQQEVNILRGILTAATTHGLSASNYCRP